MYKLFYHSHPTDRPFLRIEDDNIESCVCNEAGEISSSFFCYLEHNMVVIDNKVLVKLHEDNSLLYSISQIEKVLYLEKDVVQSYVIPEEVDEEGVYSLPIFEEFVNEKCTASSFGNIFIYDLIDDDNQVEDSIIGICIENKTVIIKMDEMELYLSNAKHYSVNTVTGMILTMSELGEDGKYLIKLMKATPDSLTTIYKERVELKIAFKSVIRLDVNKMKISLINSPEYWIIDKAEPSSLLKICQNKVKALNLSTVNVPQECLD